MYFMPSSGSSFKHLPLISKVVYLEPTVTPVVEQHFQKKANTECQLCLFYLENGIFLWVLSAAGLALQCSYFCFLFLYL